MYFWCFPVSHCLNSCDILQKWVTERTGQQRWKGIKETKNNNVGSEIGIKYKQSYRRNIWPWECWYRHHSRNSRQAARRAQWSTAIDINVKSGCDGKGEDVPEVTLAINFPLKSFSEIFYDIEGTKDETLEADPNLEKSITICEDESCSLCLKGYTMRRGTQALCKIFLTHFFRK